MKLSNPYLLIALLAVGIGLYALVPALFPFLLLGGCLLMHFGMHGRHTHESHTQRDREDERLPSARPERATTPQPHQHGTE
jgi:hypothetical protein